MVRRCPSTVRRRLAEIIRPCGQAFAQATGAALERQNQETPMRIKTDAKRQEILDAASGIFRDTGYERASMAMIAERVGGSKATLYSYFQSKEDLFAAVMVNAMDEQAEQMFSIFDTDIVDLKETLLHFAAAYVEFVLQPDVIAYLRAGIGGDANNGLGKILYERGPKAGWARVAKYVADATKAKKLRQVDPWIAALQLKGLIEAGLFEPVLYGAPPFFERSVVVKSGIEAFLTIYEVGRQAADIL
jgi:AcrR family transcriptional regulator